MRSFFVLTLVSSVFSIPILNDIALGDIVDKVTNAASPVTGVAEKVISPAVGSVSQIAARQGNNLSIPAFPTVLGSAQANATKIVGTIQSLLASTPAGSALAGPLSELNNVVSSAVDQLGALNGLGLGAILQTQDGEAEVSTQQAAQSVTDLTKTVSDAVQQVTNTLGTSVPELAPAISLINGSLKGLFSTVTSLLPGITNTLLGLLTPLSGTLNSLGLGLGLNAVGA